MMPSKRAFSDPRSSRAEQDRDGGKVPPGGKEVGRAASPLALPHLSGTATGELLWAPGGDKGVVQHAHTLSFWGAPGAFMRNQPTASRTKGKLHLPAPGRCPSAQPAPHRAIQDPRAPWQGGRSGDRGLLVQMEGPGQRSGRALAGSGREPRASTLRSGCGAASVVSSCSDVSGCLLPPPPTSAGRRKGEWKHPPGAPPVDSCRVPVGRQPLHPVPRESL